MKALAGSHRIKICAVLAAATGGAGIASTSYGAATFAQYFQTDANQDITYQYTFGTGTAALDTINGAAGVPVTFTFVGGGASISGPVAAHEVLHTSTTQGVQTTPISGVGTYLSEPFKLVTNTISFVADTPIGGKSNLLTVTFTGTLSGLQGSTSASLNSSTGSGDTISYASDFISESATDFSLSFSSVQPALSTTADGSKNFFSAFTAASSGTFAGNTNGGGSPAPEPATLALAGVGALALARRKRVR